MNIVVLNGSPKGDSSITLQHIRYIQNKFSEHRLVIFNVAEKIKNIEKDKNELEIIKKEILNSDGVLWAFPVYYFLVPSQYKRFIELLLEHGGEGVLKSKYTAALSTSVHFYDYVAHDYINAICDDSDMKFVGSFSADMYDLLKKEERDKLVVFANDFFDAINTRRITSKKFKPVADNGFRYIATNQNRMVESNNKKILVVTDSVNGNKNLTEMVNTLIRSFNHSKMEVVDLNDVDIRGGCLGCVQCGFDNICIYDTADGFKRFYTDKIEKADILIFTGAIKDRFLSSRWKLYFDRSFFNTHIPALRGKQVGFIISGNLMEMPTLRQMLEAFCECQGANAVDFITDEAGNSAYIDNLLHGLAGRLVKCANVNYVKPNTFLSKGGMKILRDDIWGRLRFVFQADHNFYNKYKLYDFPQKDLWCRVKNSVMILVTKMPVIRKKMRLQLKEAMVDMHKKIISDMNN